MRDNSATNASAFHHGFVASFPHITHLTLTCRFGRGLSQLTHLIEMLCLFSALQDLQLAEISTFVDVDSVPATGVPPQNLRSLTLAAGSAGLILTWLRLVGRPPNMRSLTLSLLRHDDAAAVRAALEDFGDALHHLDITVSFSLSLSSGFYSDPLRVFNLSLLPALTLLTIRDPTAPRTWDPTLLSRLLLALPSPSLRSISLELALSSYRNIEWDLLDAFLSSEARFPVLETVLLRLHHPIYCKLVGGALPLLNARGVLRSEWRGY
ncbi:hypothetical protein R3P38DRAFT_2865089 [Favolaschia claudopus]|uniref:Uncharacterized protein n=1 Tax=Favolaschia claudopus TaxID=2862362 RepID=A0AAW0DGS2_9AGAR